MERLSTIRLLAWAMLTACSTTALGATREFSLPPGQPSISGYAEVEFSARRENGRAFHFAHRIWFDGSKRYRIESDGTLGTGMRTYLVRDGDRMLSAMAGPGRRAKWDSYPASWIGNDMLSIHLQPRCKLNDAVLVSREAVHGLRAEHWRGVSRAKFGTSRVGLWVSTDRRFPLVLRTETKSTRGTSVWRITRLNINSPVPGYVFSAQTDPRPGLLPLLRTRYWPDHLVLAWYAVLLLAYVGTARGLARVAGKGGWRSAVATLASGVCLLGLLFASPTAVSYLGVWSGTPLMLAMALATALAVAHTWRRAGIPGHISLIGRLNWQVWLLAVATSIAGALVAVGQFQPLAIHMGLTGFRLPLVPAALVNTILFSLGAVAVEELVFRGYLMHALSARLGSDRVANVMQALLFALYHIPRDITQHGRGGHIAWGFAWMLIFGLLFGALRLRARGLGAPALVHLAFNVPRLYFASAASLGVIEGVTASLR